MGRNLNRHFSKEDQEAHEKILNITNYSVQFCSVAQSCLTLCDPMNRSTPGLPVHHQFLEFTQTYVHWVGDAIQPSHPLLSPSPPALNLLQLLEKYKSKIWEITSHQSEWPSSKSLQTINAGEGVEKRKSSCTVGGNINWYNHYSTVQPGQ